MSEGFANPGDLTLKRRGGYSWAEIGIIRGAPASAFSMRARGGGFVTQFTTQFTFKGSGAEPPGNFAFAFSGNSNSVQEAGGPHARFEL